jgi:hypothetical protein
VVLGIDCEMDRWITLKAKRVLYVQFGRDVILCDREHPGPVTLVLCVSGDALKDALALLPKRDWARDGGG